MPTQNPTSTTKPPEGRSDGGDKETSERRAKLSGDPKTGGTGASRPAEERKTELKADLPEMGSISEMLKKVRNDVVRLCRENPLTALGVAFMAGRMFRRRRRSTKSK